MKKILLLMFVFAGIAFAANGMTGVSTLGGADAENLIKGGVKTGQLVGGGGLYTFAGWMPLVIIGGGAIIGFLAGLKSKQPTDGANKLLTDAGVGGLYGLVVCFFLWAALGYITQKDMTKGVNLTVHYWGTSTKAVAGDDVFAQ